MPKKQTLKQARQAKRKGKAVSTQAGPFVREEIKSIPKRRRSARSAKQAVAIGLSKARKAGIPVKPASKRAAVKKRGAANTVKKSGITKKSKSRTKLKK